MIRNRILTGWLRPVASLFAVVAVLALSACGGGSGAPNNPYQPVPVVGELLILPAAPTIYSQVATTLTISGGVLPYRAFSSNSAVLPVTQNLPGNTITLLAGSVAALTTVNLTVQDAAGTAVSVDVTVLPGPATPPPALTVLPNPVDIFSTVSTLLTINGGVPPFRAFSSNSSVLPVAANVTGNTLALLANAVAANTSVTVTIQDAVNQTTNVAVTVHPKAVSATPLVVLPNTVTVSKGSPATISISGGLPPYMAYSSNPGLLPVTQAVAGNTLVLQPIAVTASVGVTVTVQDSAGQTELVAVTVAPDSATTVPLAVLPAAATVFSGVPAVLTVTGGVPPYSAFSSNSSALPVTQAVVGGVVPLLANSVAADTQVTITVRDSSSTTATAAITVRPATLLNNLTVRPNSSDCGTNAICSGQTGTATVTLQLPGGGPAAGRQVRFDVVAGPFGIVANGVTVPSTVVVSDSAGNAQVIILANVNAPTQPAQIRATDLQSGQQVTADFIIQQLTNGASILTVVPSEVNITGPSLGVCSAGFRVQYFIYGGTPPYRITQSFPTGVILIDSIVNSSGGSFQIETNGSCVNPEVFSILDATGRQVTATLNNVPGTFTPTPAPALNVIPGDITGPCSGIGSIGGQVIFTTFAFVISGGTPPYNVSVANQPPNPADRAVLSPSTGIVVAEGGQINVTHLTDSNSYILNFVDSSSPAKTTTRTITCTQ